MRDLMNVHSASRASTAAGSSTVNDSASPLQGARPIPVPSILADQDTSPSLSTSDYTPDLHSAQVRQKTCRTLLTEASLFSEQENTKALKKHWTDSPNPQVGQTYRYLLDAVRNLKAFSQPSLWKSSFALIVRHLPGSNEYGELLSLCGQPSATSKQTLTVKQADTFVAFVAALRSESPLPPEFNQDIGRLVKGYLQWRKEKSGTTELVSVSYCMHLIKNLHRDEYHSNSIDDNNGIHEYIAQIVSDKEAALSEAAKLEQPSPLLALFMYKLMEHTAPALITSMGLNNILHKQPEVCALLAAVMQKRLEITKALTKDEGETAQLQQQLLEIGANQLQELLPRLLPLLEYDTEWTIRHLHLLKEMNTDQLEPLLELLQYDQEWATDHLSLLKEMNVNQLQYLLPLLRYGHTWTTMHFPLLKEMDGAQLFVLLDLLRYDLEWTTDHLSLLKEMNGDQLDALFPLLRYDQAWTTGHWHLLKEMDEDQLLHLVPLLQSNHAGTTERSGQFKPISKDDLCQRLRSFILKGMHISSEGFTSAANPYVREALFMHDQDMEEFTRVLKTRGASRSTFHPEQTIPSYLTEKFKHNYQQIPDATFGVENEMFIPGLPESDPSEIENELNDRFGIKNKKYRYVKDDSLSTDAPFATPPIEQTTSILHAPEDIQRLQSALSILNDWGAFTNRTAGVHIHTGIKQWKAANCLNTPEEKSKNRFLHQWDQELLEQFQERAITPYQLLFMKQFLVNMVAMQKEFYLVSRKSLYSKPNGPRSGNDLDKYYQDVSRARDYEELLSSANVDDRYFNVNLLAYKTHKTIEVRGFTKKNSNSMEVDPNLPIRDLIFMQEVLIKVLHDTKHILLSGASPDDPIEVRPSAGLTEIAQEYVQDVFLLEALHALGQRDPEKRVNTMKAIVKDKDLMTSETLQKIRESQADLLEGDPLAQHFLNALSRDMEWNPSFIERTPLKRTHSLRSMSDAGLSYSEQKP